MPETQKLPDLLTLAEVAARFNVKTETTRRWIKTGKLPAPNAPYAVTIPDLILFAIERSGGKAIKLS